MLQEASAIYKSLLLEHRELLALNVYVALAYAKLDYYDVSQEVLQVSTGGGSTRGGSGNGDCALLKRVNL